MRKYLYVLEVMYLDNEGEGHNYIINVESEEKCISLDLRKKCENYALTVASLFKDTVKEIAIYTSGSKEGAILVRKYFEIHGDIEVVEL